MPQPQQPASDVYHPLHQTTTSSPAALAASGYISVTLIEFWAKRPQHILETDATAKLPVYQPAVKASKTH